MTDKDPYPKEKLRAVEKSLTATANKLIKAGITLSQGDWTISILKDIENTYPAMPIWATNQGKCCVIGAYLLVKQPNVAVTFGETIEDVAIASSCASLNVSYDFVSSLIRGFDAYSTYPEAEKFADESIYSSQYLQGFSLGLKLGKKLLIK